ncbi:SpoIIE family protein phosphatase [Yanghanlia caeni]|uniref:SpoIIE family protein phosphatase n=1 Tax=Yanghanlia caeni TaxID=3064283 RepID=A0ABU1D6W1_9BURK|nr:SpoIIE family protein phosphatase [Alcaligenaceae bacterium LG-2]
MRLTSLHSKIFLLVGLSLLLSAALVMFLTQRGVTRTVFTMEEHAVHNVLNLLMQDSEARWGGFLQDKIATVRSNRARLMQQGDTILSMLNTLLRDVRSGAMSDVQARALALEWLSRLDIGTSGNVWIFDSTHTVLSAGHPLERNANVAALLDYKGRHLASSLFEDLRAGGHGFAIYRLPDPATGGSLLRYAYATYLPEWDWMLLVSDDAGDVVSQINRRRTETEKAIADVLQGLRLAESGFAFILGDDGRLIAPPPAAHVGLLGEVDSFTGKTLQRLLHDLPPAAEIHHQRFDPLGQDDVWRIDSAHFRPLGWTIVAAVPERDFTRAANALSNKLGLVLLAVLALGLTVAGWVSLRLTRPLHTLSEFARALPEQDFSSGERLLPEYIATLPKRRPDEVGRLAAAFAYMDAQLREKVARLLEETSSRERLESELSIAQQIQKGLLPPPERAAALRTRVDLAATMVPAKEVGGDLYDHILMPDGRMLFAIGDVSDKGMPAALFMAGTCTLIRALSETETDPAVIMARINNLLAANNPNLMFVTLIVGVLDLENGRLEWSNAGHSPLCVLSPGGQLRLLEGRSGPACGVQGDLPYRRHETHLQPGEVLLGYTDGVTEAVGPQGDQYGEHRLYAALARLGQADADTALNAVLTDVHHFVQDTPQSDDITLITIRALPT